MTLTSPAFVEGAAIPRKHTCDGADVSPLLSWSGSPEGTVSFALICDDPDAPGRTWVHWVCYDIPATVTGLPEAVPEHAHLGTGGVQGMTDFGRIGYGGPCPPSGTHRYFFKLYALDASLGLSSGATKQDLVKAMQGHIRAEAGLMGTYRR